MPKVRTKRAAVREERKRKRREENRAHGARWKRARRGEDADDDHEGEDDGGDDGSAYPDGEQQPQPQRPAGLDQQREFFGMLADEEQEYFRRADEMLELNDFPSAEERDVFLDSVFREAQGKELKLASSQSCSRLMERLVQLADTARKKRLFDAFGGHFLSLVQHRFASHCCEALFLRSAGVVTQELAGFVVDTQRRGADAQQQQQPEASMESLFLATLDELEGSLSFLVTDRFASHVLRALLLVLSGRPLDDAAARSLMKSKRKEHVSVAGAAAADEQNKGRRAVPASFTEAVRKIMADSTAGLGATGLRVLAKHPIGNPTLQLLLELDMALSKAEAAPSDPAQQPSLLYQLLPGAPSSLADPSSEASEFINGMVYDPIGSRLIETLVTHCPGKVFKHLNHNMFLPRIQGYVRNDISSYPAIKVLTRLGKDDLVEAVDKIAPTVPQLVSKARFNVLRTLFERCAARGAADEIKKLMRGLKEGCGGQPAGLVTTLCCLGDDGEAKPQDAEGLARNQYAVQSHGAQLLTALLSMPGPSKGVQEAILALPTGLLVRLATTSMPTVTLLTTALSTPSANSLFQKTTVGALAPHMAELATSQFGHNLVAAVAAVPSRGRDWSVPYHVKEALMQQLGAREAQLRESWMGRSVWRVWRGDVWKTRGAEWKAYMRALGGVPYGEEQKPHQQQPHQQHQQQPQRTHRSHEPRREEDKMPKRKGKGAKRGPQERQGEAARVETAGDA